MAIKTRNVAYTTHAPARSTLGTRVPLDSTAASMLKVAGLDWSIDRVALQDINGNPVPGFHALKRSSDGKVMDVCGSYYQPTQNLEAFEFFNEFTSADGAHMEYVGEMMGGRIVYGMANLNITFKVGKSDDVNGYLMCFVPHMQGKALVARITTHRRACHNNLAVTMRKNANLASFSMNHRRKFDAVVQDEAKRVLGAAREEVKKFGKLAVDLSKSKVDNAEATAFIAKAFQPDWDGEAKSLSPTMKKIMEGYINAPGATPGTRWGVINAVTYYADHIAGGEARRLTNATLGKTARAKQRVLSALIA